jgi:hypothetical protein
MCSRLQNVCVASLWLSLCLIVDITAGAVVVSSVDHAPLRGARYWLHKSMCSYFVVVVRFHILTAASMKFRVVWDVAPCSHAGVD